MTLMRCTIWILGALVVMATIDALPDPPAVNPSSAVGQILHLQLDACDTLTGRCDSVATSYPFPVSWGAASECKHYRPTDRMVLTGQLGDPSPPAPHAGRKPICQS